MILTDYSALCIASITGAVFREKLSLNDNLIRHIILNKYREINVKLSHQFGDLIVACDERSWRKDYFPYYKANRKKMKDDSVVDFEMVFRIMDEVKKILHENFPFYVISVKNCEADDIIAAFAHNPDSPTCIVSKDRDFYQLLKNPLVKQWDYSEKNFIEIDDPLYYRNEKIIKGDSGDGVPNIFSDDDTFIHPNKKQKKVTQGRLHDMMEHVKTNFNNAPVEIRRNWERNKKLIDLTEPVDFAFNAVEDFKNQKLNKNVNQGDTMKYLAENKMVVLLGKMSDFYKNSSSKPTIKEEPKKETSEWSLDAFI